MNGAQLIGVEPIVAGILAPAKLKGLQGQLLGRVLFTVESSVKRVTPVRTGNLRRSITSNIISAVQGVVGTNVIYAPIVHRRNPYLQIGLENAGSAIDKIFADFGAQWAGS